MSGTIIENSCNWKFSLIIVLLIALQVTCFLVAQFIAPKPTNVEYIRGLLCDDSNDFVQRNCDGRKKCYYTKENAACKAVNMSEYKYDSIYRGNYVVYAFESFVPYDIKRSNGNGEKWPRNVIGFLHFQITDDGNPPKLSSSIPVKVDAKLFTTENWPDHGNSWDFYASAEINRKLRPYVYYEVQNYTYSRGGIRLFEFDAMNFNDYLLNIRLPYDRNVIVNQGITELWLVLSYTNGHFMQFCVNMKALFLLIVTTSLFIWYWRRLSLQKQRLAFVEKMLSILGVTLMFLNFPLEYFTANHDASYVMLFNDFRQNIFYMILFIFFIIFMREHNYGKNCYDEELEFYGKDQCALILTCLCLSLFHIRNRYFFMVNPFSTSFMSSTALSLALLVLAILLAIFYLIYLFNVMIQVFRNIDEWKTSLTSSISINGELTPDIINRFKIIMLMLATIICATLTIINIVLHELATTELLSNEAEISQSLSVFSISTYGMWNIYILALFYFYSPSQDNPFSEFSAFSDQKDRGYVWREREPEEAQPVQKY